jgi:nicotinamidase-related amidase
VTGDAGLGICEALTRRRRPSIQWKEVSAMNVAVIILDMAKGYGWLPGSFGYEMVEHVKRLKDAAYAADVQVLHVNSMRRPTDRINNIRMGPGTEAVEVIPELQPVDKDILIFKRYLSGFSHNDLDYTIRVMGIDTVVLAGASTDNCVLWTAADAHQLRYDVVLVDDCTMVHREAEPAGAKEAALHICEVVLNSKVMMLDDVIREYLPAMGA